MFRHVSYSSLIMVLLVSLFAVPMTSAQENSDLTEEELALLDRFLEAGAKMDTYASYVEETSNYRSVMINIHNQKVTLTTTNQVVSTERTQTVVNSEDRKNVAGTVTAEVTEEKSLPDSQPTTTNYTVKAEFRLVEETMYVSAAYESPDPTLPDIPEGWMIYTVGENKSLDSSA